MSLNDPLANAMSKILIGEKIGSKECTIKPISKTVKKVLDVMMSKNYVGSYEEMESNSGNSLKLNLLGRINSCGVIKPKYSVKNKDIEKYEERYLLSRDMGILIISTNKGITTHIEAKSKKMGGRLIAYCY
jgi:small subunit ribosomal protein S8